MELKDEMVKSTSRLRVFALLCCLCLALGDNWGNLNSYFRSTYNREVTRALISTAGKGTGNSFVVIANGAKVSLIGNLSRLGNEIMYDTFEEKVVSVDYYTRLKQVSHIPLTVFLHVHKGVLEKDLPVLMHLLAVLRSSKDEIKTHFSSSIDTERNEYIYTKSIAFLEELVDKNRNANVKTSLDSFLKSVQSSVQENIFAAAESYLTHMHDAVRKWVKLCEGKKFKFVVLTEHMPRNRNIAVQYFLAAVGRPKRYDTLGTDVIVGENLHSVKDALRLLGKHLVDTEIGNEFFGDESFMHSDIQADSAEIVLQDLKKEKALPIIFESGDANIFYPWIKPSEQPSSARLKCPFN